MKDIIKESGVSQGGIYRYFSDIDDILIALINKSNTNTEYKQNIDEIMQISTTPKGVIESIFDFIGKTIKENMATTGKIQFELTVLLSNHPDRQEKFMSQITEMENSQYLMQQLFKKINEGIEMGYLNPILPIKDIFYFIMTSIDGIIWTAWHLPLWFISGSPQASMNLARLAYVNSIIGAVLRCILKL